MITGYPASRQFHIPFGIYEYFKKVTGGYAETAETTTTLIKISVTIITMAITQQL
jgi:hypothetical protein